MPPTATIAVHCAEEVLVFQHEALPLPPSESSGAAVDFPSGVGLAHYSEHPTVSEMFRTIDEYRSRHSIFTTLDTNCVITQSECYYEAGIIFEVKAPNGEATRIAMRCGRISCARCTQVGMCAHKACVFDAVAGSYPIRHRVADSDYLCSEDFAALCALMSSISVATMQTGNFIRTVRNADPSCAICFERTEHDATGCAACMGIYHTDCLQRWTQRAIVATCPKCRGPLHGDTDWRLRAHIVQPTV